MRYIVEKSVIMDNRPKVIVPDGMNMKKNDELKKKYLFVKYREEDDRTTFFVKNPESIDEGASAYLPANVIASINTTNELSEMFNAVNMQISDKIKPDKLLERLYDIENASLKNEIISVQKENYEIRKLLENTKNTLLELSLFANSSSLPMSKNEFSFQADRRVGLFSMKKGKAYHQNIPVSSMYLSGIRLYFEINLGESDLYLINDLLSVKLLTKESRNVIGAWEIPFVRLEKSIVLELVSPYIESKESVYLSLKHNSDTDLKVLLSRKVFDERLQLGSTSSQQGISSSPMALEIYKNYHTFSLLSSPFIKGSDSLFREFERVYLSRRLIENSTVIVSSDMTDESGEINFSNDLISINTKKRTQLQIGNAVALGTRSVAARVEVMQGFGGIGIALLSNASKNSYLDDDTLEAYEREGYFSGWIESKVGHSTISVPLVSEIDEPMHLVLLMKNNIEKIDFDVQWKSFELYFDELV